MCPKKKRLNENEALEKKGGGFDIGGSGEGKKPKTEREMVTPQN